MKDRKGDFAEGTSLRHEDHAFLDLKFRALFENSGTSIVIIDTEGIFHLANSLVKKYLGIREREITGKSIFDFLPLATATKYLERNRKFIEIGEAEEYEDTFELPAGARTFLITDQVLKDQKGKGYAILSSSIDITERKQTEKALHATELRFKTIFDYSTVAIYETDKAGKCLLVNKQWCNFSGLTPEEAKGDGWKRALHPDDQERIFRLWNEYAKENKPWNFEYRFCTPNQKIIWVLGTAIPLISDSGETTGYIGMNTDINELKHNEEALQANYSLLRIAGETAKFGGWSINLITNEVIWSDEVAVIHEKPAGYSPLLDEGINFYAPEWRDKIKLVLSDCALKGIPFDEELELITAKGKRIWVRAIGEAVRNEDLKIVKVQGAFQDITERKKAEEEILKSKQQYDSLVSKIPVGVYILRTNQAGTFALDYVSPKMAEMLDLSVESLLAHNHTIYKAIHPEDLNSFIRLNQQGIQSMQPFEWNGRVVVKGEIRWFNISSSPQPLESGETLWHGLIVDITERIQHEAEIKLKNEELINLNATKDKFFSIIAHDLKSPFNGILGLSDYMVEQIQKKNYDQLEEYATIVKSASQQAMDLLLNLLDWSRSQTGRMEFKPERLDVVALIKAEIDLLSSSAKQKSIVLTVKLPDKAIACVDSAMFSTIIRNLISNAIKFTNTCGRIEISLEEGLDFIKISVRDNGVGIGKDRIDKLFRISENYSTSGTSNEKGTGLGLILCNEFVEKHSGKIWVESEENKGTTFHLAIPVS
jgi:PAS domain S-box-containing protein